MKTGCFDKSDCYDTQFDLVTEKKKRRVLHFLICRNHMFKGAELNRKRDCSLGEVNFVKVKVLCFKNAKIKVMASFANWRRKYLCN